MKLFQSILEEARTGTAVWIVAALAAAAMTCAAGLVTDAVARDVQTVLARGNPAPAAALVIARHATADPTTGDRESGPQRE